MHYVWTCTPVLVHRCMTHQKLDELFLICSKLDFNLHSGQQNNNKRKNLAFTPNQNSALSDAQSHFP